jgi:phosphatidylserine/phosphatidylglycerophosphate/cardiolipin synthase-like enzyme
MIKIINTDWAKELTTAIDKAQTRICITALSFLPPRNHKPDAFGMLYSSILGAAALGVQVNVIIPMPGKEHPATAQNASAAATLRAAGCICWLHPMPNLLHAKTVCIDRAEAWVGSGNFTAAAAHHNREAWIQTDDDHAIASLQLFHAELIKNSLNSAVVPA